MTDAELMFYGLVVGAIFGFVLQCGRFCMNSAFRDILVMKEYTLHACSFVRVHRMLLALGLSLVCVQIIHCSYEAMLFQLIVYKQSNQTFNEIKQIYLYDPPCIKQISREW